MTATWSGHGPFSRSVLVRASLITGGTVAWRHTVGTWSPTSHAQHAQHALADLLLMLPAVILVVGVVETATDRLRRWRGVVSVATITVAVTALAVPLAVVRPAGYRSLPSSGAHRHGEAAPFTPELAGMLRYGITQALDAQAVVLVFAVLATAGAALPTWVRTRIPSWTAASRLDDPPWARPRRLRAMPAARLLLASIFTATLLVAPAAAEQQASPPVRNCAAAPQRVFDVHAIDVDIVVDRFGDHDPYGYMYVLADREDEVRAQEQALITASAMDRDDPAAARVSVGLRNDPIQPLVLRARLGECVVVNLTNKITKAPRNGFGQPVLTQPGGVPAVSMDMSGVAYDAAGGAGGQAVGQNPTSVLVAPGETRQYRYYLDPQMGEGTRVFRSGGESSGLTAHGLFGALIAESAGARWFDPENGAEKTGDNRWSNWEAMVQPVRASSFREFTLIYHEMGAENFAMRRPVRENDEGIPIGGDLGIPIGDQVQYGRQLPMIDARPPTPTIPNEGGAATNAYRPTSRAINYRSESFFRRLQLEAERGASVQRANESLAYSSYTYGDPATPMPRSYLGEPTKTRIVHAGMEQLHVHHVHGGGTRWRLDPGTDNTAMDIGLSKGAGAKATSIRLDSQTVSPTETFDLLHECGAGGCQQAAGDFLYHCHIAQHYIAGMWGLWRVFDTAQPDLARLPGRAAAPTAVNSAGLIGRTIEGKRVVPGVELTDPGRQIALEQLVENSLPPQGARWTTGTGTDRDDATVWDWQRSGTELAPVYLGEPETASVWPNYRPTAPPGSRPEIRFNPVTGRPAYPMLRPHLGYRPPFAPGGHGGAPGLGATATQERPGGLCPRAAPVRDFDVTAVAVPIQATARERDPNGEIYVLNEDKAAVLSDAKPVDPLVIRSNVGDCVAITFGSELNPNVQSKVNMHTHLVQFDPLASDGVIAGFAYEQSVFAASREGRTLTSVDARNQITVSSVDRLRPGISIGIGVGRTSMEIRTITAIDGSRLTFDADLKKEHLAGEPVTVEFVQYRWYSDVDAGTVFWHDHVNGITSWAHGLFAALIIEPAGSVYRDPVTGAEVRSGPIVDVVTTGSVGVGQSGAFREFTIFLHNGRRGRGELAQPPPAGLTPFNGGQECEEGSINLRAAPLGERTPPGVTPADPATTDQRREYNGGRCRNAFSRVPDVPGQWDRNTVPATVTTVDPYVFSSVKYGDPMTPLLRAYAGDPVVIRTIGLSERAEALRIQGHRFRIERFNGLGELTDTATTGISERFDYVLDGGAGGVKAAAGDYLYYSTRTFALESGAWGLFRVFDGPQDDLKALPGRRPPAGGPTAFPTQTAATGDTQQTPGPNPKPAYRADGSVDTSVATSTVNPCPPNVRVLAYDVAVFDHTLPTAPFADTGGVVYALASDVAAIRAGTRPLEPLVLRANAGDCVTITLHNQISPGSRYGGTRVGLDLGKLIRNQQLSAGVAIGLNPDTSVGVGQSVTYRFHADGPLGTSVFSNLASPASLRHGAYGMLIVEPAGSTWTDSVTGAPLGPAATSTQAIIRPRNGAPFREFALTMQSTDQQFARSIQPYGDQVAGNGLNSDPSNRPTAPVPGAPPGAENTPGSFDKGFNHLNYRSEPLTSRLGLTSFRDDQTGASVVGSYGIAFSSGQYGDPDTPVFRAHPRDPVVFRVGVGATDQLHSFTVSGHMFPQQPGVKGTRMLSARTLTAGETLDAWLGPAGGVFGHQGDYLYSDTRMPFAVAGMWGILRIVPRSEAGGPKPL
ncbi:hypothetical protein MXD62_28785 [Frankia sp. Mgl5]|uniref:hypothetical protein n=1 Tax=Frankia sp. Mgl5 TaxID=2933793 RepID=UPI00200E4FC0|nr:hypothetical protein [Frankia sp. Mgl5]MCK9931094.1 hypothetical protein [Frankia sp. Mgl5]